MSTSTTRWIRGSRRRTLGTAVGAGLAALGLIGSPLTASAADGGGHKLTAKVITGVQIYTCQTVNGKTSFVFARPEAQLQHGIHHFAGPTWQAPDGSAVVGHVEQTIPRQGAIPELVLSATAHTGKGLLSTVTTIRREKTRGGLAPTGPCTPGATASVPYSATYVFIGVQRGKGDDDTAS